ncbi:molybdopterin converting factor subunit 1 [Streptomyces sp. NPDC005202]|uniref:Molybdopterin converting factor subunit 1 n=1 Tax=Streptomyces thermocarboxydovorans TaxID=59298 RepID=A0ABN1HWX2_9ACTN
MQISVLYFGALREQLARTAETVVLPDGSTLQCLIDVLHDKYPELARVKRMVKVAVNEDFMSSEHVLEDGDEIALLPPIAGGAEGPYARLSDEPLRLDEVLTAVTDPSHGAVVTFTGLVRNHNEGRQVVRLEYEAYRSMALKTLTNIVERCEAVGTGVRVAVTHRVGVLEVGEPAVMIAAAAPHRAEALEACTMCIELLKSEVPIWKKESSPDGYEWVGMRP